MQQYNTKTWLSCRKLSALLVKYVLLLFFISNSVMYAVPKQSVQDTVITATATVPVILQENNRQFKPGFKENYNESEFNYTTKPLVKSRLQRIKEAFYNWLGELFTSDNPKKAGDIFTKIMWAIALIVVLFVVYIIVAAIVNKDGSMWIFGRARKKINISDAAGQDITQINFKDLIDKTKQENNYRLAVRYYYLWLLKKMSLNNIIEWNWDKTNSDYLYEIKDGSLKKDFEYLSYVYDYSWYGEFVLTDESFAKAEKAFLKTFKSL